MRNRILLVLAVALALIVGVGVHSVDFHGSVPEFVRLSGGGVLLDAKPAFSEDAIYQRLADYGEQGRSNYEYRNRTIDVLLPLAVFPALFLLMVHALDRFSPGRITRAILYSLPALYVLFDLAENSAVLMLLSEYPSRLPFAAGALPYLTVIKRAASLLSLGIPLVLFIIGVVQKRASRSKEALAATPL
jgi:hypothetical protein